VNGWDRKVEYLLHNFIQDRSFLYKTSVRMTYLNPFKTPDPSCRYIDFTFPCLKSMAAPALGTIEMDSRMPLVSDGTKKDVVPPSNPFKKYILELFQN
jgi:hypothetical protein